MNRIKACKDLTHLLSIKHSRNNVFLELSIQQVEVEVDLDLHHQLNQENKETDKLFLQHLLLQQLFLLKFPYQRGFPQQPGMSKMSLLLKPNKNKRVFQDRINSSRLDLSNLRALQKQICLSILRFQSHMFLFQEECLEKLLLTERRRNMHLLELKIYLYMK